MNYYKEHGIRPAAVSLPAHVDTFKINKKLHLKQVSELIGIPHEEVRELNPQYPHDVVPGGPKEYILRLPYTYSSAFVAHEDSLYRYKADTYLSEAALKKIVDGADGERIVYRVKSGDYLGRIASKHRCTVAQIKRWNNLKSNNISIVINNNRTHSYLSLTNHIVMNQQLVSNSLPIFLLYHFIHYFVK